MKALVLSDIHSNIFALEAIWARECDSDIIVCTGDLVDYGPYPREVIAWVQEHQVVCTQGNHDAWVALTYRRGVFGDAVAPGEREWRHHNAGLLSEREIRFLENLPPATTITLDGVLYGMTHLYKDYELITSTHAFVEFTAQVFRADNQVLPKHLILGHTHRQAVHYLRDNMYWLNPGSVSYRRLDDPDQAAHYATIVDGTISLKQLDYDLAPLRAEVERQQLKDDELQVARWFFGSRDQV
jgi:putative phosphoesterase